VELEARQKVSIAAIFLTGEAELDIVKLLIHVGQMPLNKTIVLLCAVDNRCFRGAFAKSM
jgi:hypothetical protein